MKVTTESTSENRCLHQATPRLAHGARIHGRGQIHLFCHQRLLAPVPEHSECRGKRCEVDHARRQVGAAEKSTKKGAARAQVTMMSSESRIELAAAWLVGALAALEVSRWHGESSERFRTGDIRFRSCTKRQRTSREPGRRGREAGRGEDRKQ
jgi:hypothetical protein